MPKEPRKKLSAHDVAFGIGRIVTDEQLKEYLERPVGKFTDSKKVLKEIKNSAKKVFQSFRDQR